MLALTKWLKAEKLIEMLANSDIITNAKLIDSKDAESRNTRFPPRYTSEFYYLDFAKRPLPCGNTSIDRLGKVIRWSGVPLGAVVRFQGQPFVNYVTDEVRRLLAPRSPHGRENQDVAMLSDRQWDLPVCWNDHITSHVKQHRITYKDFLRSGVLDLYAREYLAVSKELRAERTANELCYICGDIGFHRAKDSHAFHCGKHWKILQTRKIVKHKYGVLLSYQELDATIPSDLKCPVCEKTMVWTDGQNRKDTITFRIESATEYRFVCYACSHSLPRLKLEIERPEKLVKTEKRVAIIRFLEKIRVSEARFYEDTPCWEWDGTLSKIGYGQLRFGNVDGTAGGKRKLSSPHRFAYLYFIGDIPDGQEVDHKCEFRRCCSPFHLQSLTHSENSDRRPKALAFARRMNMCARGHEFTPDNVYINPNGARVCLTCSGLREAA